MTQEKEELSIEEAMKSLDSMVERLESREISLEDSFKVYQEGMDLLKFCNSKIDTVEKKMLQMDDNGELSEF